MITAMLIFFLRVLNYTIVLYYYNMSYQHPPIGYILTLWLSIVQSLI